MDILDRLKDYVPKEEKVDEAKAKMLRSKVARIAVQDDGIVNIDSMFDGHTIKIEKEDIPELINQLKKIK